MKKLTTPQGVFGPFATIEPLADRYRAAVDYAVARGSLPEGDWRIYRLDGNLDDLAYRSPQNRYTLKRMAEVVDWVTEDI